MLVLALRSDADAHAVGGLAEAAGLEVAQITMEDEDNPQRDVLLVSDDRQTTARYIQDFYLDLSYLVLSGPNAETLAEAFADLVLDPEVLFHHASVLGLDERDREAMKTLVRLALTASPERRAAVLDVFSRIAESHEEGQAFTLIAALSALTVWPGALYAAKPVLTLLATHESEMVREEAQVFGQAFDRYLRQN
ncbi:MAG: hypothetical protein IAE99_09985 [Rhodothermales bacterium]|nr:hypothetical protein [Rhodothermales bacterium]